MSASVSKADVRTPRLDVWGFMLSLIGLVPWLAAIAFAVGLLPDLAPGFAWSAAATVVMLSSLLSIPGLLLSRRALRLARKRQASEGLAMAGFVLGIVGTVVLVLASVFAIVFFALFIWGMAHGE
jgi:hypothetical protein